MAYFHGLLSGEGGVEFKTLPPHGLLSWLTLWLTYGLLFMKPWLTYGLLMDYLWLTFYLPTAFRAHARFPVVLRGSLELSAVQPSTVVAARRAQLKPGTTAAARRGEYGPATMTAPPRCRGTAPPARRRRGAAAGGRSRAGRPAGTSA